MSFLTSRAQDRPARQQTIEGAIGWSYDLLEDNQKQLFRSLGLFVGGFTLEASEAVYANEDESSGIDVFDGLASLAEKSLINREESTGDQVRFSMLEMIREYAVKRLEESGEGRETRRRHTDYVLAYIDQAQPNFPGPDSAIWFGKIQNDIDNIRASLVWCSEHDKKTGLRIASPLYLFWAMRVRDQSGLPVLQSLRIASSEKYLPKWCLQLPTIQKTSPQNLPSGNQ